MFPVRDWQFWVVTLAALALVLGIARSLKPRSTQSKRVNLTIEETGDPEARA
ncbi:MAG: hypothetical protein ACYTF7_05790 [Planctomycetota bacterium]|jgi:hypothetical protein